LGLFPTKCDVHYGYLSFTWNCPPGRKTLNPSSSIPVYRISFHLTRIFVGFKKEEGVEKSVSSAFVPEGRVDLPARQQAGSPTFQCIYLWIKVPDRTSSVFSKPLRVVLPIARNPDFLPTVGTLPLLPVARDPNSIRLIIIGGVMVGRRIVPSIDDGRGTYPDRRRSNKNPKMAMAARMSTPG
jgi:hypothetical protein